MIKAAVGRELDQRGWRRATRKADITIHYYCSDCRVKRSTRAVPRLRASGGAALVREKSSIAVNGAVVIDAGPINWTRRLRGVERRMCRGRCDPTPNQQHIRMRARPRQRYRSEVGRLEIGDCGRVPTRTNMDPVRPRRAVSLVR